MRSKLDTKLYADGEGKEKVSLSQKDLSGVYAASSPKRRALGFEQSFIKSVLQKLFRQTERRLFLLLENLTKYLK